MSKHGSEYINSQTKRNLDISVGSAIALGSLPISLTIGLEAMIEHRSWHPFFKQERVGRRGAAVMIRKFETLRKGDEAPELHSGSDHPNASVVGKIIRRAGLDEMPQILNVLNGDISLVGIRPMPTSYMDYYQSLTPPELFSQWRECYLQNPGLTGDGQLFSKQFPVHTPAVVKRRLEIDVQSFENASFGNDLRVLAMTPLAMMRSALGFTLDAGEGSQVGQFDHQSGLR